MVEKARRSRVEGDRRGTPVGQWEVFVRDEEADPLRHVGSVAAESATEAHEHASRLFGWYAVDLWVCPAEEVARFSTRGLGTAGGEDESEAESDEASAEPRVYEETEGSPEVRES
ncbi:Htur_1727 family rSAM-partnered candidate RiPP [Salinilacihabitans rarus]|uniref:Htur_1727 family rSAM-partnered candidate RiPP n=1 Tax=Salinilacihabitans rarus TaxID=2961596 RepID=UPI0020C8A3A7|nr:Htur_1727 family rSAM-partnered candidate RiPP [Salinilacihabitans rarus]